MSYPGSTEYEDFTKSPQLFFEVLLVFFFSTPEVAEGTASDPVTTYALLIDTIWQYVLITLHSLCSSHFTSGILRRQLERCNIYEKLHF